VFGGCYLPHLRRAVKSALLECERRLAEAGALPTPAWTREDGNGDGREEVYVRTRELTLTLNPALGGAITELGYLGRDLDVGDVLARRPEIYHAEVRAGSRRDGGAGVKTIHDAPAPKEAGLEALLAYDEVRRGSLLDGWFDAGTTPLDPVSPWERALLALPGEPLGCTTREVGGAIAVTFTGGAEAPVSVEKAVTIREATVEVRYRLTAPAATPVAGRWAVQWNLALTAGDAPGRYLTATGRPSLGSTGRERDAAGVALVDEWIGVRARLAWAPAAELAWGPVQTVSVSEAGFERIYQGTAVLVVWPVGLRAGETRELVASITLERL